MLRRGKTGDLVLLMMVGVGFLAFWIGNEDFGLERRLISPVLWVRSIEVHEIKSRVCETVTTVKC